MKSSALRTLFSNFANDSIHCVVTIVNFWKVGQTYRWYLRMCHSNDMLTFILAFSKSNSIADGEDCVLQIFYTHYTLCAVNGLLRKYVSFKWWQCGQRSTHVVNGSILSTIRIGLPFHPISISERIHFFRFVHFRIITNYNFQMSI